MFSLLRELFSDWKSVEVGIDIQFRPPLEFQGTIRPANFCHNISVVRGCSFHCDLLMVFKFCQIDFSWPLSFLPRFQSRLTFVYLSFCCLSLWLNLSIFGSTLGQSFCGWLLICSSSSSSSLSLSVRFLCSHCLCSHSAAELCCFCQGVVWTVLHALGVTVFVTCFTCSRSWSSCIDMCSRSAHGKQFTGKDLTTGEN